METVPKTQPILTGDFQREGRGALLELLFEQAAEAILIVEPGGRIDSF